ncbi:hypothetical protein SNE40_020640 [Patella caerulea]|uniref:Uncharacterized protein n=1 Tax=Patella caerulea TaxID=87958 RepID=A0AAN8J4T5_PATCE
MHSRCEQHKPYKYLAISLLFIRQAAVKYGKMKGVGIFLVVVCLAVLIYEFEASCSFMSKDPPGADELCVTPVGNLSVGESANSYTDCERYTCEASYISVCGIGYKAGTMSVHGCIQQNLENCCYQFVNASNSSEICMEKECP